MISSRVTAPPIRARWSGRQSLPALLAAAVVIRDHLVHHECRLLAARRADLALRHARDRAPRRYVVEDDASRSHPRAIADLDIAEDLGPCPHHNSAPDLGMAIAPLVAGAAEGNAVQHRAIVADHGSLADDDARGVVEHDALADHRRGVDVDLQEARGQALQIKREVLTSRLPKSMRNAVGLERMEALVIEQGLDQAAACRIALGNRHKVGSERLAERRLRVEHLMKHLMEQPRIESRMLQAPRQPMADRILEALVVEHRRIDETAERRL